MRVLGRGLCSPLSRFTGWIAAAAALACLSIAVGASGASAAELSDFSGGAFQILAPGEEGGFSPGPFATDQGKLYDNLTPFKGQVTQAKLEKDYLSEKFGVQGTPLRTEETGRAGLEIIRDSHDIPHIFGHDPLRRDVRLGLGRRRGPRPAARAGPRPGVRRRARRPGRERVRPAAHAALVHAERGSDRIRRRTEERPQRRGPQGRTGDRRPRTLGRRRQRLRVLAPAAVPPASAGQHRRRDRRLRFHRLDLRQRRRQRKSPTPNSSPTWRASSAKKKA